MLNPLLYKANNNNIPQSMEVRMEMTVDKNLNYHHSTHISLFYFSKINCLIYGTSVVEKNHKTIFSLSLLI